MFKLLFLILFCLINQFCNAGYQGLKRPERFDAQFQERSIFFQNVMGFTEKDFCRQNPKDRIIFQKSNKRLEDLPNFIIKGKDSKEFNAGYFQQFSLKDLREIAKNQKMQDPIKFGIIYATEDMRTVDVGALQADIQNRDAVFLVASNFNVLETLHPNSFPKLTDYIYDKTQGPFASISAFPGLMFRKYYCFFERFKDDPNCWEQMFQKRGEVNSNSQINLLEDLGVATQNGHIVSGIENICSQNAPLFKIGFHSNIQVTYGLVDKTLGHQFIYDSDQLINQVFAAAINMSYFHKKKHSEQAKLILKWIYEATLKAAVLKGKKRVFLTRIGGGVFANKQEWIDQAIIDAVKDPELKNSGLEVILNNYDLPPSDLLIDLVKETKGSIICGSEKIYDGDDK